jgi:hypothetical protein
MQLACHDNRAAARLLLLTLYTCFCLPFDKLRMLGSKHSMLLLFSLYERKNKQRKKIKYRCE